MKIAMWVIFGLIIVAILTHAPGFAIATTSLGGVAEGLGSEISGAGITQGSTGQASMTMHPGQGVAYGIAA